VILCDGFYEWKAPKTPFKGKLVKQPYFIYTAQPEGVKID
jgi:putative SOS response-associated peptidase YedK